MSAIWKYRSNTTINDPSNGNLRLNAADVATASLMALSHKTLDGTDAAAAIAGAQVGDVFEVQAVADVNRWARYQVAGAVVPHTGWSEVPLEPVSVNDPTFAEAEAVTLVSLFPDVPGTGPLVTLEEAKRHLYETDPAHDPRVTEKLTQASAIVLDYLKSRGDPAWTADTAPRVVQAAVLLMLGYLYEHAGDDLTPADFDTAIWVALENVLKRSRDPAYA